MISNNSIVILYVEDEPMTNMLITSSLKKTYPNVHSFKNGAEGLKGFYEFNPDIVITDLNMPIMCGCEMIHKIREINSDIPIIINTAFEDKDVKQLNYIEKPINIKKLLALIEKTITGGIISDVDIEKNLFEIRHHGGIFCDR